VSLDTLYSQADVISVHSPLTPESNNLIDAQALAKMKPSTLLLNMGRGGIINEADLEAALRNGTIRGAALDVLAQEPPAKDHPLLQKDLPNLLVLPHIGWASVEARQALVGQVTKILQALPNGPFINRVMP
jgi:glycerate dehydrogenase